MTVTVSESIFDCPIPQETQSRVDHIVEINQMVKLNAPIRDILDKAAEYSLENMAKRIAIKNGLPVPEVQHRYSERTFTEANRVRAEDLYAILKDAPKGLTLPEAAKALGVGVSTASHSATLLRQQGRLKTIGARSGVQGRWVVTSDILPL